MSSDSNIFDTIIGKYPDMSDKSDEQKNTDINNFIITNKSLFLNNLKLSLKDINILNSKKLSELQKIAVVIMNIVLNIILKDSKPLLKIFKDTDTDKKILINFIKLIIEYYKNECILTSLLKDYNPPKLKNSKSSINEKFIKNFNKFHKLTIIFYLKNLIIQKDLYNEELNKIISNLNKTLKTENVSRKDEIKELGKKRGR